MKNDDIHKNNYIEGYLLRQLSEEEVNRFEEHLLFCESCRNNLVKMENLVKAIELANQHEKSNVINTKIDQEYNKRNEYKFKQSIFQGLKKNKSILINIAAVILIITIIYFNRFYLWDDASSKISIETKLQTNLDSIDFLSQLHTPDFKTNQLLEDFITDNVRSNSSIKVSFSQLNTVFKLEKNGKIKLNFEGKIERNTANENNQLHLRIFSNSESDYINDSSLIELPLALKISDDPKVHHFLLAHSIQLERGLYYFTIESISNDDPLYTEKFYVY